MNPAPNSELRPFPLPSENGLAEAMKSVETDVRDATKRGLENVAVRAADLQILMDALADVELLSGDRHAIAGALDNARQRGGSHAAIPAETGAALLDALRRSSAAEPV